jgi:hypothetical protein
MKKFILIWITIIGFWGCAPEPENTRFHLELLPVEGATFPDKFVKNEVYEIPITYKRPTTCYVYDGFYYDKNANIRTIAIQVAVLEQGNCVTALQNPVQEILKFKPTTETSYIFKLWKGKDAAGADTYQEIKVPVVP